mmetsp:Transcript_149624/g.480330  ORF Transcript_149624/g.480330 Transcript_149624/m.480330 type:complete len:346 (-) Transcript_149624:1060-2097(-)
MSRERLELLHARGALLRELPVFARRPRAARCPQHRSSRGGTGARGAVCCGGACGRDRRGGRLQRLHLALQLRDDLALLQDQRLLLADQHWPWNAPDLPCLLCKAQRRQALLDGILGRRHSHQQACLRVAAQVHREQPSELRVPDGDVIVGAPALPEAFFPNGVAVEVAGAAAPLPLTCCEPLDDLAQEEQGLVDGVGLCHVVRASIHPLVPCKIHDDESPDPGHPRQVVGCDRGSSGGGLGARPGVQRHGALDDERQDRVRARRHLVETGVGNPAALLGLPQLVHDLLGRGDDLLLQTLRIEAFAFGVLFDGQVLRLRADLPEQIVDFLHVELAVRHPDQVLVLP